MGMDFRVQVWKRVCKMEYFGLKLGQDLGNRAAHPYQEYRGGTPPPSPGHNYHLASVESQLQFIVERQFVSK